MATEEAIKDVETVTKVAMRPPGMFNVVLFNDNTTPMEFVIVVLMQIFHKNSEDATQLTMEIHNNGQGIAGTYSLEVANQKRDETILISRNNGFDLRCETQESQ